MSKNLIPKLLVVEDSDEDFEVLRRIFQKLAIENPVYRCVDGEDALEFLYKHGKYQSSLSSAHPSLILLDLNLPGTDGREVLAQIKQDPKLKKIPVIVLTTSSNPKDIEACYCIGASGYLVKPIDSSRLMNKMKVLIHYWFEAVTLPD